MKLVEDLKKEVEKAADKAEIRAIMLKAGIELTDEELDEVAGGVHIRGSFPHPPSLHRPQD